MLKRLVRPAIYGDRIPLEVFAHHVHGEPIPASDARSREYVPFSVGQAWGGAWDTTWFRMRATDPGAVARVGGRRAPRPRRRGDGRVHGRGPGVGGRPAAPGPAPQAPRLRRGAARGRRRSGRVDDRGRGQSDPAVGRRRSGRCSCPMSTARRSTGWVRPISRSSGAMSRRSTSTCWCSRSCSRPCPTTARAQSQVAGALESACDVIERDDVVGRGIGCARRARAGAREPGRARRAPHDRGRACAHRLGLAVADPRDEAQVRADVLQRAPADGGLSRVPLLRVTGAAVPVDEGGLSVALRAHARPGARPVASSPSGACGSRPTATSRRASRWCARSCTASASSSTSSTGRRPTSGSPTCSATRPRSRRSSMPRGSRRSSRRRCRGARPTGSRTARSGGRASTAPGSSPTSRRPTPTTAT